MASENEKFHRFQSFLHDRRGSLDETPSHVSLIFPKGRFRIDDSDMDTFWDLYAQVERDKGMAEMTTPLSVLPIIVDFDLKKEVDSKLDHNTTGSERRILYLLKHVQMLVEIYQRVLRDILQDVDERHLVCFLLEKDPYYQKCRDRLFLKNGFHLHFPFLFLDKAKHDSDLLPRVRFELKKLDISQEELPSCYSEQSLDRCYTRNPWLLYGSQKDGGRPYRITCALDAQGRVIDDWQNLLEEYHLYNVSEQRIRVDVTDIDAYLPQILSLRLGFRNLYVYETKKNLPVLSRRNSSSSSSFSSSAALGSFSHRNTTNIFSTTATANSSSSSVSTPTALPSAKLNFMIDQLLSCLLDHRVEQRNEWMHVGWILFNIYGGREEGYLKWLEFSRRSAKFQESVCYYEWSRMQMKDLTVGSLKYIAREDNEALYNEIMRELNQELLDRCYKLDGTHHDLALALFQKYESYFVCASVSQRLWFEFRHHIWTKVDEGYSLRRKISGELAEEYETLAKSLLTKIRLSASEDESEKENKKLKYITKLIKNLKLAPFKSHILKECSEVFYREDFISKLDSNPYLIAFSNGIYDIRQHSFREGHPTDFISLKMNIEYHDHFLPDGKEIREIDEYFTKIFPDEELREYFLDSAAEIFIGGNFNKVVQIWSGEGDNGKSITQQIFEHMLGPYSVKLPTSLITGKRTQSSAACPELARAGNGVRLAMLQEPDQKDVVNIGILKELSGNDTFFARGLYKEGQEITPMFKLVLICNEPPKVTHSDKAAWNRIKMIPFESTFSDDAPDSWEEQLRQKKFPKDLKFRDKIPRMAEPLAFLLLKRLRERPESRKLPIKVMLATENYKRKNDIFKQYLDEWIVVEEGRFCYCNELYLAFREWHKESCPNQTCPDRNEFLEYVVRLWGRPIKEKDGWSGRYIRGPVDHH